MEKKINYARKNKKRISAVDALTEAQKIAFAPFTFQVVAALLEFNLLKSLNQAPKSKKELEKDCNISRYALDTLFDAALCIGLVEKDENGVYSNTKLADAFLFDEMTRVNFNFMKDVCCKGALELVDSFKEGRPKGLQKHYFESKTIYQVITKLPEKMKKSWYEFDHHYSDNCFEEVLGIIFQKSPRIICDIGGNTGKFENACLKFNSECEILMIDLPENIEAAKKNFNTGRCHFLGHDILSDGRIPFSGAIPDAVFMSQFLDCFSVEQILFILNKVAAGINENTRVYILEPFIDNQRFEGAAFALSHISLYFTCMANGNSKMYNEADMREIIEKSGLKLKTAYHGIGKYDYTLLECVKK